MKRMLLFSLLVCCPALAFGQDSINPYNIQQACNILLQDSNVYYRPFAPPGPLDMRANLSTECNFLNDSNGVGGPAWDYEIKVYDYSLPGYVNLRNWHPCGIMLGQTAVWQRLFTAKRDSSGHSHDIVAGGGAPGTRVTISANEDVDFRASGRVILKSGFHVKPGAFFHAYTDPKWDTAVFSDEFDDSAKFVNQWHISNGHGGNDYGQGNDCPADSNAYLVTDTDAHDGHALDLVLRESLPDTCHCTVLTDVYLDSCQNIIQTATTPITTIFPTAFIRSCPFPFTQRVDSPFSVAYLHEPYGKYEVREKIPHVMHHTNNWGGAWNYGYEYDMNETEFNDNMSQIVPDWGHALRRGPFNGVFGTLGSTRVFIGRQAEWCLSNSPNAIVINNVAYAVQWIGSHGKDTVELAGYSSEMGWPSSLTSSTDSVTFYYTINGGCTADSLPWHVYQDSVHQWRIFSAGYHINRAGDTLKFSKKNQPTQITLITDHAGDKKTFNCRWDSSINWPVDKGLLLFDLVANDTDSVKTMASTDLHSGDEAYAFQATDLYNDAGYPVPPVHFNADDTTGHYEYHTFAMEWLPHEVRFLVDSVVVRRFPDRLVPPGTPYSDWVTTMPRAMTDIRPAEIDIDWGSTSDPFGTIPGTQMYMQRQYLEHALATPGWPGVWPDKYGHPAAHHLIDYIKVWDVPKDVQIPNYPH